MKTKYNIKLLLVPMLITAIITVFIKCSEDSPSEPSNENMITITSEGGEYTTEEGIIIRVPAGAVDKETDILVKSVNEEQVKPIFDSRRVPVDNLLACFEGSPDGIVFNKPIQISLNVNLEPGDVPIVHEVDLKSGVYMPAEVITRVDPDQDTMMISLKHFSSYTVENMDEFKPFVSEECIETPCRCGDLEIIQADKDYLCNNAECTVTETKLKITYLDCPQQPVEEYFLREVSDGCELNLSLTATSHKVRPGGETKVLAYLYLGCAPMAKRSVDFSLSSSIPATLNPTYNSTDEDGVASTTLTAGDQEGVVTVNARSTQSYYTYTIYVRAGGEEEEVNGPMITEELKQSIDIQIEKEEDPLPTPLHLNWAGTIVADVDYSDADISLNIDFNFTIGIVLSENVRKIEGIATAAQSVSLFPSSIYDYDNLIAPFALELFVYGRSYLNGSHYVYKYKDGNYFKLNMQRDEENSGNNTPFYTYKSTRKSDPEATPITMWGMQSFYIGWEGTMGGVEDALLIPLEEGTYSIIDSMQYYREPTTYTITLNKVSP